MHVSPFGHCTLQNSEQVPSGILTTFAPEGMVTVAAVEGVEALAEAGGVAVGVVAAPPTEGDAVDPLGAGGLLGGTWRGAHENAAALPPKVRRNEAASARGGFFIVFMARRYRPRGPTRKNARRRSEIRRRASP